MAKAMFPGGENAYKCWNCGIKGHRVTKCRKPLDLARISANRAEFLAKKGNKMHATKRVLYEAVSGLSELCGLFDDSSPTQDVKAFFGDLAVSDDACSSTSESDSEDVPEMASMFNSADQAAQVHHAYSDSAFLNGSHPAEVFLRKRPNKKCGTAIYHRARFRRLENRNTVVINVCTKEVWTSSALDSRKFQGACVDTGAQQCVSELKQAKAYCKSRGVQVQAAAI